MFLTYDEENIQRIIKIYQDIKDCLIRNGNADLTLITKILLGVFGFVPAFDNYFCNTFRVISNRQCGFRNVSAKSLNFIKKFYEANQQTIDRLSEILLQLTFETEKKQ